MGSRNKNAIVDAALGKQFCQGNTAQQMARAYIEAWIYSKNDIHFVNHNNK